MIGHHAFLLVAMLLLLMLSVVVSLGVGGADIGVGKVLVHLAHRIGLIGAGVDDFSARVLDSLRLPRILRGVVVGAGLGVSGAVMQSLFRNPIADPGFVGVSASAAFGAVVMIVAGGAVLGSYYSQFGPFAVPVAAFVGAVLATSLIRMLSRQDGHTDAAFMLLIGVAINAIAFAGVGIFTYMANDAELRSLTFWQMGTLSGDGPADMPALAIMTVGILYLVTLGTPLNLFLLGEAEARHLGIDVEKLKRRATVVTALVVGAAVAVSGIIGFVGLVAPHLVRLVTGPDNKMVLPASALGGAIILTLADAIARIIVLPAELPIGLVTGILGGPFFLGLLLREKRRRRI
ncbi:FecCD family ABC transporter permease [Thalassospira alkalitolerans]|uniref:Iron ABC transporter n=1 Tax=Thalassospira alkalitolerans TaxID=1293890 RepID=A0A1Y2LGG3_9PROT|nr:iron ABC transporter permease [Thalassospira alkalitolerans]OSQ50025.1 iron ABC transporter [Thalassospira alkalitolerans]|tara:strand:- start:116597 stop:117637 length:1041 start_codon:yes stop_codon:yes gene_type:complete